MNVSKEMIAVIGAVIGALFIIVLAPVVHAANAGSWPAFWVMTGFLLLILVGAVAVVIYSRRV